MPANRISAVLEQTNIDAVNTAISSINTSLPFLVDLSADEKKSLPKFGDKSVAFVMLDNFLCVMWCCSGIVFGKNYIKGYVRTMILS